MKTRKDHKETTGLARIWKGRAKHEEKLANNLSLKIILFDCLRDLDPRSGTIDPVRTNVRYSGIKVEVKMTDISMMPENPIRLQMNIRR